MGLCFELYACQVSDGYLVKQASSSGSNFSRFWQLMEEKFGPKVLETPQKSIFWKLYQSCLYSIKGQSYVV